jgi:hypothetical protein
MTPNKPSRLIFNYGALSAPRLTTRYTCGYHQLSLGTQRSFGLSRLAPGGVVGSANSCLAGLVGDLLVDRDRPVDVFADVTEIFHHLDVLFGNLEGAYTDEPHLAPSARTPVLPRAHNLDAFVSAGFSVLSLANNHICDAGHAALLETRSRLRASGIATCGAGDNLAAAREPAILKRNDLAIAFLAYASVFPVGYEARARIPGLAPLRAYELLRPKLETYHAAGVAAPILTAPDEVDLENVRQDIALARARTDLVITSFHWGDYSQPYHLTDHEIRTAHWCIDNGADLVVGHHHHSLRGMEWYKNKPILYGLGHFVFDFRMVEDPSDVRRARLAERTEDEIGYEVAPRRGWPLLPLHPDTRMTVLAWATCTKSGIPEIGVLPCHLTPDGLVHPLDPASALGGAVLGYLSMCNDRMDLNGEVSLADPLQIGGYLTARILPRSAGPRRTT